MAQFTQIIPSPNETNVSRTTGINFTVLDDAYGVNISTLSVRIDSTPAILNGNFVNGYSGNIASGVGKYVVGVYPKSPYFARAVQVDIVLGVRDGYNTLITQNYSFFTPGYGDTATPIPETTVDRACDTTKPFFPPTDLGLKLTEDEGTGTEIKLEWLEANPSTSTDVVFYNIYVNTDRNQVYDGYPEFISESTEAIIGGLRPGDQYFFGVRATEFNPSYVTLSGRTQVDADLYKYYITQLDGYIGASDLFIPAVSTAGFANYGILLIDNELIRYSSKNANGFVVTTRGLYNTFAAAHGVGSYARLYVGKEDGNKKVVQNTPTFQKPNYAITYVLGDGYGNDGYRDGYDGYAFTDGYLRIKQKEYDNITSPLDNNDNSGDFPAYDYCGTYRSLSPASFMQGQCVNTYFGGARVTTDGDGNRILVKDTSVRNHMLNREELLLETTGEPVVLLRRLWTGIRCHCVMLRREHPDARCPTCMGTGYVQGYVQFFNNRRSDRRILIRVDPATDDINIMDRGGLEPSYEPSAWTMAYPGIRDRDVIIRFNPDNNEEFRYEILSVDRVRAFFAQTGAQKFRIKRFPKTDIIYQFPALRDASPAPTSITTSVASAPAVQSHSHGLVVPDDVNLSTFNGATLISEGHNHIIINGVVYPAAGHTHTL